jgi:pyruvate dehydrogenase phosphatase
LVPQPSSLEAKDAVENAIIASFKQLDAEILASGITALKTARTHTEALSLLAPGYAGSCCLLSIFDPNSSLLRVACVGDSRAVLGSADPDTGRYVSTALSEDQTGFNPKELDRVRNEHPGEKKVIKVKTGRVLGLAVSTLRVNILNLRT